MMDVHTLLSADCTKARVRINKSLIWHSLTSIVIVTAKLFGYATYIGKHF